MAGLRLAARLFAPVRTDLGVQSLVVSQAQQVVAQQLLTFVQSGEPPAAVREAAKSENVKVAAP